MRKKKYLLLTILFIAIGFATIATTLFLNGTIKIGVNADFVDEVIFTAVNAKTPVGKEVGGNASISADGKKVEFITGNLDSINKTASLEFEITNNSTQYDAEASISCTSSDENYEDYLSVSTGEESYTIKAGESVTDLLEIKLIKTALGETGSGLDIAFTCEINATAIEKQNSNIPIEDWSLMLVNDANSNGIADNGDEMAIGSEHFYVISNDGTTLNALAKYNLNAGGEYNNGWTAYTNPTGIQDSTMRGYVTGESIRKGTLAFSDNSGWSYADNDDIDIQQYDGSVKSAINAYKEYLPEGINVRLITKTELEGLGCSSSDNSCSSAPSWVNSTSYWSGSASAGNAIGVWVVDSDGHFFSPSFRDAGTFGLRPVITVDLTNVTIKIPSSNSKQYTIVNDANSNKVADIGDEIALGDEHFYVISNDGTNINALAKYNLLVGNIMSECDEYNRNCTITPLSNPTGIQDPTATAIRNNNGEIIGTTSFSNASKHGTKYNDYRGSIVEGYVNNYVTYLNTSNTGLNATGRLILIEELATLINDGATLSAGIYYKDEADAKGYQWQYSTNYYTGTPSNVNENLVWGIASDDYISVFNYNGYINDNEDGGMYGVRPVITIAA